MLLLSFKLLFIILCDQAFVARIIWKMLRAQRFPDILKSVLSDGVEGVVIMSAEGSILSSVSTDDDPFACTETAVAAVCSCIYANYQQSTCY